MNKIVNSKSNTSTIQGGHFSGIYRKVQLKPLKWVKIAKANSEGEEERPVEALMVLKYGGVLTHAGRKQVFVILCNVLDCNSWTRCTFIYQSWLMGYFLYKRFCVSLDNSGRQKNWEDISETICIQVVNTSHSKIIQNYVLVVLDHGT